MTDTITLKELEEIEIDWTQGVAENFERVKAALLSALEAEKKRADKAEAELAKVTDPNAVHVNMLRGTIAKPSVAQIKHLYGDAIADPAELTRLRARADKAEDRAERFKNALQELQQWVNAYPLDIYPEPNFRLAAKVLTDAGLSLDAISASNMRHVLTRVEEITRAVLNENETGNNAR